MKSVLKITILPLLIALVACGGSGGGILSDPEKSLSAGFDPDEASPGQKTVAGSEGPTQEDMVTVEINVAQTDNIYGAAFDLTYDPSMATYVGWSAGNLLEQGPHTPAYQVSAPVPGQLVVAATRQGLAGGVAAGSTPLTIIQLTFQVTETGSNVVGFDSASLYDAQIQPAPIPGVTWEGGSLVGVE